MDFTVYAAARGSYETGLTAPNLDAQGNLVGVNLVGTQIEYGAFGAKSWRKVNLGLDYRGDYRYYNQSQYYNGTNQAISVDLNILPTRRVAIFLREGGGTSNRAFGGFAAPTFVSPNNYGVPLNEVYDSRIYYSQTSGGLAYRMSARSTVTVTGDAYFVKRSDPALIGMQGYRAGADYMYRLTRRDSVGFAYSYITFEYPRIYGGTNVNSFTGIYARQINRKWKFQAVGGLYRYQTTGTQEVTLSPEVALILGRPSGVEAFKVAGYQPQVDVSINYAMERSGLYVGYTTGVSPGNGVYIASRGDSFRGGYSYSGIRKMSLGLSAGYTRYKSLGLELGDFSTFQAGGGMNYKIARYVDMSLQIDRRRFNSPTINGRTGFAFMFGLSYSPARFPLSIW